MHHAHAARGGQELVAEAQQAAGGHNIGQPHAAIAGIRAYRSSARAACLTSPPPRHRFGAGLDMDFFKGFQGLAVLTLAEDHFRARDLEFIAFPAHGFDQDRQVQLAAAGDQESIGALGFGHSQGDIVAQLFEQALAQLARGAPVAFPACKGEVLTPKVIRTVGSSTLIGRQGNRVFRVGQGFADGDALQPGQGNNFARFSLLDFNPLQPLVNIQVASPFRQNLTSRWSCAPAAGRP